MAVIGAAIAAIAVALGGCGKKQEPAPVDTPSASSAALEPLIQQYADLERKDEDDESGGLRDVSLEGFKKEIDTRRQLLEKVQQVDASGLSREEDIDRRLMIGLLESTIHTAEARRMWENDASLYVPAGEIGRALEPTAPGTPQERATTLTKLLEQVPARIEQGAQESRQATAELHRVGDLQDRRHDQAAARGRAGTRQGSGRAGQSAERCRGHGARCTGRLSQVPARGPAAALDRHVGVRQREL